MSPAEAAELRRESLKQVFSEARVCERCPQLAQARTQVVFGAGNADADVMFVGEAPGEKEDLQGVPFVGAAGKLLGKLLENVGLSRDDVFIANVLKCRPPQNRDPLPQEIERCEPWLWSQIALIEPIVVITLGRYATGLLRGEMAPLGSVRGRPEIRVLGTRAVRLYPVLHPAAALYRREPNLRLLEEDFARIPELLALGAPPQPSAEAEALDEERPAMPAGPQTTAPGPDPADAAGPADDERVRFRADGASEDPGGPEHGGPEPSEGGPAVVTDPGPARQLGLF